MRVREWINDSESDGWGMRVMDGGQSDGWG